MTISSEKSISLQTRFTISLNRNPATYASVNNDRHHNTYVTAPDPNTPVALALDFNEHERDDEREANARLIAAAPELATALEEADIRLALIESDLEDENDRDGCAATRQTIRAALKAAGLDS